VAERYYTESHEWVQADGDVATVGITDFAQSQLGDVVFLELPSVGRMLESGDSFGVVESVKAASDLYSPVSGSVVEVNEALGDNPETVNRDPFGAGWLIKVRLNGDLGEGLLDEAGYKAVTEGESH
jgi:glycine cleavage system H protein